MLYEFTLVAEVDASKVDDILDAMHDVVSPSCTEDSCPMSVASAIPIIECRYCTARLHKVDETWVDETDGDACWGDDDLVNESGVHTPT